MATSDDNDEKRDDAEAGDAEDSSSDDALAETSAEGADANAIVASGEGVEESIEATTLGSERYVHAAFFLAGIILAYVAGKVLALGWNNLASWPAAVRAIPQLVSYSEEQRDTVALAVGAGIGTLAVVQSYRKPGVRTWAGEVAAELSKVTWPTREAVMNGTVVVVVASALGTIYIAVLDRIFGFLTTLVYGA
jgi:preprotein translocase subunit SecE